MRCGVVLASVERSAFDQLIRAHQSEVYQLAKVLGSTGSRAEAIVEETFLRAYRAMDHIPADRALNSWLLGIAVDVIRTSSAPLQPSAPARTETLASGGNLDEPSGRQRIIDRALATLSDDLRLLVVLRDIQGLGYHEIAAITGASAADIQSRVFDARRQLRPLLEPLISRGSWIVP